MAIEAETLLALSEKCPAPVKAVGRSLVVQQSEHRRFESYLGSPEMAQFLEALVTAYRDGSLIHRSALAEDAARAAEGAIALAELRKASDAATQGEWIAVKAGFITPKDDDRVGAAIADGIGNSDKWPANRDFILKAVKFARAMLADTTPNKEAADANR